MFDIFSLLFNLGLLATYAIAAFVIFLIIQLISYRVLNFNLYRWLTYNLIDKQL